MRESSINSVFVICLRRTAEWVSSPDRSERGDSATSFSVAVVGKNITCLGLLDIRYSPLSWSSISGPSTSLLFVPSRVWLGLDLELLKRTGSFMCLSTIWDLLEKKWMSEYLNEGHRQFTRWVRHWCCLFWVGRYRFWQLCFALELVLETAHL